MIETVIVRRGETYVAYSGWIVNRSVDSIVLAAVSGPNREPSAVIVPLADIVAGLDMAA